MRVVQPEEAYGSLKWLRLLADSSSSTVLDKRLREAGALRSTDRLNWQSPLRNDLWAEYRDADFLKQLGLERLASELAAFWPLRGPQWDALATAPDGHVFLFEAKAHLAEMASKCYAKDTDARKKIGASIAETKAAYGAAENSDWLQGFYQYANRLAHLYFLRKHGVPATLVFVYFIGDKGMGGPSSTAEWKEHLTGVYRHLGLIPPILGVVDVFVSVDEMPRSREEE